jgi:pyrroline-5-carboxylate reductase
LAALEEEQALGFGVSVDNREAIQQADVIVLAVLPQQIRKVMQDIADTVQLRQIVVSVASGVSCRDIKDILGEDTRVVRAMPNTAIAIGESMTCVATDSASEDDVAFVEKMFETVGAVVVIQEDLMTSATALCACGIAFFLRSIRAASQGGVEIGFHAHDALKMAVQTAKGAAELLSQTNSHPEWEIDKVTSPKGCTIAGLNEMEHHGLSSAFIKGIKLSAQKAGGLYNE